MDTVLKETFRIDNAKIYYETAGQGDAIVLVHAGFLDNRMWDAQFAFFSRFYRVVRFDMRGYGRSDAVDQPVVRRDEVYHLMKHLGIEKAVMVGCSLGGEMVLDFALEHPNMVSALVVISTAPGGFEMQGEPPALLMEMFAALQQNDARRASDLQVRLWVIGNDRSPEQVDPRVRQYAAEMTRAPIENGTYLKVDTRPLNPLNPPAVPRLKEIQAPTLIIAGALDHPELVRAADFMEKEIAGAKKTILADSAHIPSMDQPDAFNQTLLAFLRERLR